MISQRLDDIEENDILALISNAVPEGRTIEYKRGFPSNGDADKKEFLADVSSFANSGGGDLIFGVDEMGGVPTQVVGTQAADPDLETRRMESIMASGLDPRIRYAIKTVTCREGLRVLIIRVERSWVGPHRVVFKGHDKFYGRNSAGKYPLDVGELRAAFTLPATVAERIRAFRTDRIISISNGQTPVPLRKSPAIILHCIPIESFVAQPQYDLLPLHRNPAKFGPMAGSAWGHRLNLEGLVVFDAGEDKLTYTQLYRTGVIEAVDAYHLARTYEGRRLMPSSVYERLLLEYLPACLTVQQELGASTPIMVGLTLTQTRGLQMWGDNYGLQVSYPIDSDTIILPESTVPEFGIAPGKILKPLFDLIWNACGYPASRNFDADGNWIGQS